MPLSDLVNLLDELQANLQVMVHAESTVRKIARKNRGQVSLNKSSVLTLMQLIVECGTQVKAIKTIAPSLALDAGTASELANVLHPVLEYLNNTESEGFESYGGCPKEALVDVDCFPCLDSIRELAHGAPIDDLISAIEKLELRQMLMRTPTQTIIASSLPQPPAPRTQKRRGRKSLINKNPTLVAMREDFCRAWKAAKADGTKMKDFCQSYEFKNKEHPSLTWAKAAIDYVRNRRTNSVSTGSSRAQ